MTLHLNLKKTMTRNDPPLKNPLDYSDWLASLPEDRFFEVTAFISELGLSPSISESPFLTLGQCTSVSDRLHVDELALRECRQEIAGYSSLSRRSKHWRSRVGYELDFEPVQLSLF